MKFSRYCLIILIVFSIGFNSFPLSKKAASIEENPGVSFVSNRSLLFLSTIVYNRIDGYYGSAKPNGTVGKNAYEVSEFKLNDNSTKLIPRRGEPPIKESVYRFEYFMKNHAEKLSNWGLINKNWNKYHNDYKSNKSKYNPPLMDLLSMDLKELKDWELFDFIDEKDTIQAEGMFGAIFYNRKTQKYIIAYRGTSPDGRDISADLGITKKDPRTLKQYKTALALLRKIPKWESKTSDIVLTGHSLGGYLAFTIGVEKKIKAITFNSPGVDPNSTFYKNLRSRTNYATNFVMKKDTIGNNTFDIGNQNIITLRGNKFIGITKTFNSSYKDDSSFPYHSIVYFYEFTKPLNKKSPTKTGYVNLKNGTLNVRNGPGTNYKVIGSLKNNVSVTVYSQSKNGWSEIEYNKKRAYVSSEYLRMYSFLKDPKKVYTYYYPQEGKYEKFSYKGIAKGEHKWTSHTTGYTVGLIEDSIGLYVSYPESETDIQLIYPIKVGMKWIDMEVKYEIVDINGTLKTKAGTFKNVVIVKSVDSTAYYAPNIGFIKAIYKGKTSSELFNLTKK